MIISIQSKVIAGPWGGGNLFAKNLIEYLTKNNFDVINDLYNEKIDVILMTDPLKNSISTNYSFRDIKNYKKFINPNVKIIHRINECDERKGTKNVNKEILHGNSIADFTVFVSKWLKKIYENIGLDNNNRVIISGSDREIFNNYGKQIWNGTSNIKIVTHHWGANENKGFDIYKLLDEKILEGKLKGVEFTYIGNLPKNFGFKSAQYIKPLQGLELAEELKKHHIYLTASKNEPSGNHHIEGAQCGLPLLYINSGGVVEYCDGYGISFENNNDFFNSLQNIIKNFDQYYEKILKYPNSSEVMCNEYLKLIQSISNDQSNNTYAVNNRINFYQIIYKLNKLKNILI